MTSYWTGNTKYVTLIPDCRCKGPTVWEGLKWQGMEFIYFVLKQKGAIKISVENVSLFDIYLNVVL